MVVEAPIELAFSVFTEGLGSWFPPEYNLLDVDIAERVFEPRVGGQVYDRGTDGSECHWARVLAYEPPSRIVISWDIGPNWQVESDPAKTSEVEVRFSAESETALGSSWSTARSSATATATVNVTVDSLDQGARSRVTIAVDFEGHGIGRLLVPLVVRREAQKEMPMNLQRLKERLESGA